MDLHFTTDEPTAEEREAVDACLAAVAGSVSAASAAASPASDLARRRQYLLPVLHALQERIGWISPGGLNHASRQLGVPPAEAFGVADFYALFETREQPPVAIHVCDDIGCRFQAGANGETLCAGKEKAFGSPGQSVDGR